MYGTAWKRSALRPVLATLAVLALVLAMIGLSAPARAAGGTTYEAESAALSGGAVVETDHAGYTGTGFVGGYTDADKGVAATKFAVTAAGAGSYTTSLRYANGNGSAKTLSLYVNGSKVRQITLAATANWDSWATETETVTLANGAQTIAYQFDSTDTANVNLDNIVLTSVTTPTGGPEAENAVLSGGAVVQSDHTGYTGTGFVGGYTDANKGTASTKFTVSSSIAGTAPATLRYSNGAGVQQSLSIYVNGTKALQTLLPATADWNSWATKTETLTLNAGSNTVDYRFDTTDTGNVNLDSLTMGTTTAPVPTATATGNITNGIAGKCMEVLGSNSANGTIVDIADCSSAAGQQFSTYSDGTLRVLGKCVDASGGGTANKTLLLLWDCGTSAANQVFQPYSSGYRNPVSGRCIDDPGLNTTNGTQLELYDCNGGTNQQWSLPAPLATGGSGLTVQAESTFLSGGPVVATSLAGAVGGSYVTGFGNTGSRLIATVNAASTAAQSVQVRYSATSASTVHVYVNGLVQHQLSLPSTGSGSTWATVTDTLTLRTGLNTITFQTDSGDGAGSLSIDQVVVANGTALATRGATLPYQEVEAESGTTNATVIAASRAYNTIASESSGRRAVQLSSTGQYVQFTLSKPANSVVIRYVIPDTSNGSNYTASLGLYIGGTRTSVTLTNKYSWTYGSYPFNNDPTQGNQHHFYDEVRVQTANMAAGTVVKLQKDASDTAGYYVIDLVDFEQVDAAYAMPANFVSITSYGATANDGSDDTTAINNAVAAAKSAGKGVWIPSGQFEITSNINFSGVTLRGAGPWYSVVHGNGGKGGLFVTGSNTGIFDLSVSGDSVVRNDCCDAAGIEGNFGTGSMVQNVWMEHNKVGMWVDTGTNGLYVGGVRIRDTWADGINIHGGSTNVLFTQSNVRGTGDDAMAMDSEGGTDSYDALSFDTTQDPVLANNAAVYGGGNMRIENNVLADTVAAGGGVNVSTAFGNPFNGPVSVQHNTLLRTGSREPNLGTNYGGIWVFAKQTNITTPVTVNDNSIQDSTYSGIVLDYNMTISGIVFSNIQIVTTGLYGIEVVSAGSGTFSNVTVSGAPSGGLSLSGGFVITRGSGDTGW